jgi:toxin YoeB
LREWAAYKPKTLSRIFRLLDECTCTPFEGIGKPEPLRGELRGFYDPPLRSRRIDDEHRLVCQVTDEEITVFSLQGHYE